MKLFPINEHPVERVARVAFGFVLLSLAFVGPQTAWGYLGVIPLHHGSVGEAAQRTLCSASARVRPRRT